MAADHFLDGMLGRSLCYAGIAAMSGMATWRMVTRARPAAGKQGALVIGGLISALLGAGLLLNTAAIMAVNVFVSSSSALEDRLVGPDAYWAVLHDMDYGRYWLFFLASVLALSLYWRLARGRPSLQDPGVWLFALAGLGALALMGHAADTGLWSWPFAVDFLHMTAAIAWLGGLTVLVLGRVGALWPVTETELRRFSRFAGIAFVLALALGVWRLWLTTHSLSALFSVSYGWVLAGKLLAVTGVIFSAWRLRHSLAQAEGFDETQWERFDDTLGIEVFFAALLILAAALLTQLPPPPDYPAPSAHLSRPVRAA